MSVTAFPGKVRGNLRYGRTVQAAYATNGFQFSHATEAGIWKLTNPGKFEFKTSDEMDKFGRPQTPSIHFTSETPLLQTTLADWKTIHLLSQFPHNLQLLTQDGEYLNFVRTTNNDYVTPAGSELAGMTYKAKFPNKGTRSITMTHAAELTPSQYEWIFNNTGISVAGGSGGTALGLTQIAYDPTEYVPTNFAYVLVDGNDVGILEDGLSIEIDTSGFLSQSLQPYSQSAKVTATIVLPQTSATDLLAAVQNGRLDKSVQFYSKFNEQFNFMNGVLRPGITFGSEDKPGGRKQTLVYSGEVPYNDITIDASGKIATFNFR